MKQLSNVTIVIPFLILSFLCLIFPKISQAAEANKFGIHILEPTEVNQAAELVNSSGGDWGWVTIVIRDDDMNHNKWQDFFDQCREKHLIPIVRIATRLDGNSWVIPKIEDAEKWSSFLNNLNWPVADKYVVIFNEPNQAKEWGNEINPRGYARILDKFIKKFHSLDSGFLILNAGLDLAAPNGKETMETFRFMQEMNWEVPGIFESLDGWTSHSYPNHGYLGKPWDTGKTSVKGYEWELSVLKNDFKVRKELPVFITETGWPKNNSKIKTQKSKINLKTKNYYDEQTVAQYFKYAFENVWLKGSRVKAVTPFLLNYPAAPFFDFAWIDKEGNPFPQCSVIQNISKSCSWPQQETKIELINIVLPPFMPENTEFLGEITLKNIGQSIWGEKETFELLVSASEYLQVSSLVLGDKKILPGEITKINFTINATKSGDFTFSWNNLPEYKIKVLPKSVLTKAEYGFWKLLYIKLSRIF